MRLSSLCRKLLLGKGSQIVAGLAAGLLLVPVPAFGFMFLNPWSFTTAEVAAPTPITSSMDNALGGILSIDMGFNPLLPGPPGAGPVASSSFITATRMIRVTDGANTFTLGSSFETLLQGANVHVFAYVKDLRGQRTTISTDNGTSGVRFGTLFSANNTNTLQLASGDYNVILKVQYEKNRFGLWDNSLPRPGSPHTFTLTGD